MATTATSSARLVTHAALFDELGKIAEAQPSKKELFKKWLKNSALHAAGAGAGTAVTLIADRLLSEGLGKSWKSVDPKMRMLVLAPIMSVAAIGSQIAARKLMEARKKAGG